MNEISIVLRPDYRVRKFKGDNIKVILWCDDVCVFKDRKKIYKVNISNVYEAFYNNSLIIYSKKGGRLYE